MIWSIIVYCVFFIYGEILAILIDNVKYKRYSKVLCFLLILTLSVLVGFRSPNVGKDTFGYYGIIQLGEKYKGMEVAFKFLIDFLNYIIPSYVFVFFVVAFITNALFLIRFYELRVYAPLRCSFPVYYMLIIFSTMSGIRQLLAVAIAFFATRYIYSDRKKIIKYGIMMLSACLMHRTAIASIILIVPEFIKRAKELKWYIFKGISIMLMPIALFGAWKLVITRYSDFLKMDARELSIGAMIPFRMVLLILIMIVLKKQFVRKGREHCDFYVSLLCLEALNLLISGTGYFWHTLSRISWYPASFTPVLYGSVLALRNKTGFVLVVKGMIILVILYYYLTIFRDASNELVPYEFFWDYSM